VKARHSSASLADTWLRKNRSQHSRTRRLSEVEVYSTMYYGEKIKPAVEAARGEEKLSRSENLALIRRITSEMWARETIEIKEIIWKRMEESKGTQDEYDDKHDGGEADTARLPEDFQQSVLSTYVLFGIY
jgi:hypothetical protein